MQRKRITGLRVAELEAPSAVADFFHQDISLQLSSPIQKTGIQAPQDSFILGISPSKLLAVGDMERNSQ